MFGRGTSLSLSLSLVARTFWHTFGLNLKGFFTHFVVVSSRFIVNFSHFAIVLTHLFTCKRHFLGHCAFLKFLNALFVRFCALFVILSLCKKATQRVARRKPQQKNPHKLKENLPFLDTSLTLSMTRFMTQRVFGMTNSGFCLKITDIFTQILGTKFTNFTRFCGLPRSLCSLAMTARQKFKFFTQNSSYFINLIHFINSKHFINFTQNLSLTQGFFISLPQIFEQFLLINLVERRSYGNKKTEK